MRPTTDTVENLPTAPASCGRCRFWITGRGGRSVLREPLLDGHHVGRFRVGARPTVDDPSTSARALYQDSGVVRRLAEKNVAAIARVADRVMPQKAPFLQHEQ